MAKLSPEALQRIADALPESYNDNPDQFLTDWQAAQDVQQQLPQLQEVSRWYEASYKPWWQQYGGDFGAFEEWKARGGDRTPEPAPVTPAGPSIDFGDEQATRHVYDHFEERLSDMQTKLDASNALLQQTIQTKTDEMYRLLALQEQAYGILNEATWNRIEPGWRPPVDIPRVVQHAQQYNIPDLRRAYDHFSQGDREKALSDSAYARGLEAGRRAAAAEAVTTEMGNGTPYRHSREPERRRGYGIEQDAIIAASQARSARRSAA